MTEEIPTITITFPSAKIGIVVKMNTAALRLNGSKIQKTQRYMRKELLRGRREAARVHAKKELEAKKALEAKEADKPSPPAPRPLAKVETSKAQMSKSDPFAGKQQAETLQTASPLKKVTPATAATPIKKEDSNA